MKVKRLSLAIVLVCAVSLTRGAGSARRAQVAA